ncbi:hypothetical protein OIU85_027872 [Salix viminalis]|uniref:Reverse transcriptase zinc-binding domain-containing protein n=1 Tax=Salix viminalis TaxID=40686 RepID=A0A9Q0QJQ2_SALVM|nr:hypothetical protein OIU85_027872 [Salix viminalis]
MDYLHLEDTRCKLCNHEEESHEHLFFQCRFSSQVWRRITGHAKIFWPPLAWGSLIDWIANKYHNNKLVHQMIGPLLLAAAVYHLWQERNRRVFHNNPRTIHLLCEDIYQQIRIRVSNHQRRHEIPEQTPAIWGVRLRGRRVVAFVS